MLDVIIAASPLRGYFHDTLKNVNSSEMTADTSELKLKQHNLLEE